MSQAPKIAEFVEWEEKVIDGVHLTAADALLVEREQGDGRLEIDDLRAGLRVSAKSWVGVVRLTQVEIRIRPKLAGGESYLIKLIDRVAGVDALSRLPGARTLDANEHDLFDMFVLLLCEASELLIRSGVLADYVEREEELGVVRGRLLVERQVLERFGRVDRLICRYDEHQTDIVENQILAAVLRRAARQARSPSLRNRAHRLAEAFAEVCDPDQVDLAGAREAISYHRMNARYQDAHRLAWLVLDGLGVRDLHASGPTRCFAFLINMNTLFERFVEMVVRQALAGTDATVRKQRRDGSVLWDATKGVSFGKVIPDLLVDWGAGGARGARARLPIDAKYKLYGERKAESGDVYQAFLYASAYGGWEGGELARALIVYPSSEKAVTHQRIQIRRSAGAAASEIGVVGVPIAEMLDELGVGGGPCLDALVRAIGRPACVERYN
jgi:5-methylcytosine-specific restriction enzyme subunit McrC